MSESALKLFDSIEAFSKATGLSTFMLRRLVKENKLPYICSGKKCLINTAKALQMLGLESVSFLNEQERWQKGNEMKDG